MTLGPVTCAQAGTLVIHFRIVVRGVRRTGQLSFVDGASQIHANAALAVTPRLHGATVSRCPDRMHHRRAPRTTIVRRAEPKQCRYAALGLRSRASWPAGRLLARPV